MLFIPKTRRGRFLFYLVWVVISLWASGQAGSYLSGR